MIKQLNVYGVKVRAKRIDRKRKDIERNCWLIDFSSGAVPENSKQYYGFTRFAIELNELDDELKRILPPTDTRFRPDQRFVDKIKQKTN